MHAYRYWFLLVIFTLLLPSCTRQQAGGAQAARPKSGLASCPVTRPPDLPFTPPEPYPSAAPGGQFWFGSSDLWTAIPQDGIWSGLPENSAGFSQKVFWWRAGYDPGDEPEPDLVLTGRTLDSSLVTLLASQATQAEAPDIGSAMLVGVEFPAPGCWEISGRYAGSELSFVIWIEP